jgi:hypothetical protein
VAHGPQGPKEVVVVKKVLLIVVVAALALTLVPLAIAGAPGGGGWKHGKAKFNLVGAVTAVGVADTTVDPAAVSTITIKVKAGTRTVRAFRGADATMTVALDAKIRLLTEDGAVVITLDQVPLGAKVKARGTIDRSLPDAPVFIIRDLKVKAPPAEPTTPPPAE